MTSKLEQVLDTTVIDEALKSEAESDNELLNSLLETINVIYDNSDKSLINEKPVIEFVHNRLEGDPYRYPINETNSLTLITGQKKSHKSRLISSIVYAVGKIAPNAPIEIAEHKASYFIRNNKESICIYFDTEKSIKLHLPKSVRDVKKALGYSNGAISNVFPVSLRGVAREQRLKGIKLIIKHFQEQYPGKRIVALIDLVTDLGNINDVVSANDISDYFSILTDEDDVSIVATSHLNPGDIRAAMKATGHIGTALQNKATVIINMASKGDNKESKQPEMQFTDFRDYESPLVSFKMKVNDNNLLETLSVEDLDEDRRIKENVAMNEKLIMAQKLDTYISSYENKVFKTKTELIDAVREYIGMPEHQTRKLINNILDGKDINGYRLMFETSGKMKINYKFTKVAPEAAEQVIEFEQNK